MIAKIQKWGNSQGIRVPKTILDQCHISIGEELEIKAEGERITLEPVSKIRSKYKLEDLIKKIPNDYENGEEEWGLPQGKEIW